MKMNDVPTLLRTPAGSRVRRSGFVLMEVLIAVAIFALAVLALGESVRNCLAAQILKDEDERARRLLENRMTEIIAGSIQLTDKSVEEFKQGMFAGMTLTTTRVPLQKRNEKDQELFGLFAVTLETSWMSDGTRQVRDLSFYIYPRQQ